jgi:AcrR family transcriptional regulator
MAGRRERRKEMVRRAVLDAAIALFAERGIYATRIEDITERADLGKGAFYNYFASKDALVAELLSEGIEVLEASYLADVDRSQALPERLARVVRLHDRFFEEHPQYLLLFHQARGMLQLERGSAAKLRGVFADYLRRIGDLLQQGAAPGAGETSADDASDLAAAVVGAITGYRSYRLAASLPPRIATIIGLVAGGVPAVLASRERS